MNEPKISFEELQAELDKFKPKQQTPLEEIHYKLIDRARKYNPPISWFNIKRFFNNNFTDMNYSSEYLRKRYIEWLNSA